MYIRIYSTYNVQYYNNNRLPEVVPQNNSGGISVVGACEVDVMIKGDIFATVRGNPLLLYLLTVLEVKIQNSSV